tara:strand:+ start:1086 stop:2168 length:1083 start_codon:yes stop_codon:yes gene_type:complete
MSRAEDLSTFAKSLSISNNQVSVLADNLVSTHSYMFRNKIINGDMSIAQRATPGGTAVTTGGSPVVCDRWHTFGNGFGTYILSHSTDAPAGFANSLLIANTVSSSASGSDHFGLQYKFEGQELQSFAKGNSTAQPVTVSWYSKTTNPGVYTIELDDRDNTRSISATFSATTTWTRHSVTFPGDTVGQLDNDNVASVHLSWWLMAGPNFTSGTLQTAWDARTNANRVSSTNNNLSNGSSFYITGVQLEIGNIATPFEHRPIGVELSLCQRYFIKGNAWVGPEWMTQGGNVALPARHNFPVIMNHTPDLTNLGFTSQNGAYTHSPSFNDIYPDGFTFKAVLKAGQSAYTVHGGVIYSADAEL